MKTKLKISVAVLSLMLASSMNTYALWNTNSIGDDGNPQTEGNAGAIEQREKLKSPTKLMLRNDTNSVISSIQIKDPDGKIYYSNNNLNCVTGRFCEISASGLKLNKNLDAFFFDSKNKLVSVYDFSSVPDSSQYEYIYASNLSLGLYIYSLLEQMDKQINFDGLVHAFGDNSDKYSPFELLGGYYQQQIESGKSSNQTLDAIDHAIKNNGTLTLSPSVLKASHLLLPFNQTKMVGSSATKNPFCSSSMKTVAGMFEIFSKGPLAGISTFTKLIGATQYSACPSSTPDYTQQFQEINEQLSELRDQMNRISDRIGALSDQASLVQITNVTNQMDRDTINMETELNQYYSFLRNQPDQNGKYHTTLQSYITTNGGIDKVMNTPSIWNRLSNIYAGSNQLRTSIRNLDTARLNLRSELNSFCRVNGSSIENITGSIMRRRIDCNYYVFRSYMRYVSIATASQQALQDMLNSTVGAKGFINFQYQNNQIRLNNDFNNFLQGMERDFGSNQAFTQLTNGLDSRLTNKVAAVGCVHRYRDSNGQNISEPYILDWHGGTTPYIEVMCPGDQRNTMFRSRYQYRNENISYFNPRNVMGVLVPNEFFTANTDRLFSRGSEVIHSSSGITRNSVHFTRFITPQNSAVYSENFDSVSSFKGDRLNPFQFSVNISRNPNNPHFRIMAPLVSTQLQNVDVYENRANYLDLKDSWIGNDSTQRIALIRYTNESNISRISALYFIYALHGYWMYEKFQQQCMTFDCRASSSSPEVRFGDTRYSWTASPSGLLDSSYIMTINGQAIPVSRR